MMNDIQLLELAAKAADIEVWRGAGHQSDMLFRSNPSGDGKFGGIEWNPRGNDADAFRLAAKLGLQIDFNAGVIRHPGGETPAVSDIDIRRAIVRAAAEIEKRKDVPQNGGCCGYTYDQCHRGAGCEFDIWHAKQNTV